MYCKYCGSELNENQAVCLKCGVAKGVGNAYCENCGNPVNPDAAICVSCGVALNSKQPVAKSAAALAVKPRELVKAIILSVITCGIYAIYWYICLTNELNALTGNEKDTSGGMCFLLGLITCGIYNFYWAYKMGEKKDTLDGKSDSKILYLILMFICPIVTYALIQDAINKNVANN